PRVRRSGLVGVRTGDTLTPVICVELVDGATRGPAVEAIRDELLALAAGNPVTSAIRHVLFCRRLPVDPRHTSKLERPALARWATKRRGSAAAKNGLRMSLPFGKQSSTAW